MKKKIRMMKARIAYMYAKMKAEQLGKFTTKRQFVLMTDSGKLIVMGKELFYKMRRRGSMPTGITPRMLPRIAVYYTAGKHGGTMASAMPPATAKIRKQKFLEYIGKIA